MYCVYVYSCVVRAHVCLWLSLVHRCGGSAASSPGAHGDPAGRLGRPESGRPVGKLGRAGSGPARRENHVARERLGQGTRRRAIKRAAGQAADGNWAGGRQGGRQADCDWGKRVGIRFGDERNQRCERAGEPVKQVWGGWPTGQPRGGPNEG